MKTASPLRVAVVFGTRPEAIKVWPVIQTLRAHGGFAVSVVVTGQHRQMLDETLQPLGVVPDVDLDVMTAGQTLNEIVTRTVPKLDALFGAAPPDFVMVQGDTTSAFCAALAAFHRRIKVAHVEAGLRSGDRFHPYPEEANRRMIGAVADVHFPPTPLAAARLRAEGVSAADLLVTGNTAIDALLMALERAPAEDARVAAALGDARGPLGLITLHRREAWAQAAASGAGSVMDEALTGIRRAAEARPDVTFVFPVHLNPKVREAVSRGLGQQANVRLIEPLPYLPFVRLMARASVIVTDSGGIQEEGPSLGVPVLILRRTTERGEALGTGMNRLVGTSADDVAGAIAAVLDAPPRPPAAIPAPSPFGDGRAAARIRDHLLHLSGRGATAEAFSPPTLVAAP